jgi:hypothetical protein
MHFDYAVGPDDQPPPFSNYLVWWKAHSKELPLLSELAKSFFLCIPSISAPSDRVFSIAGLAIT